MKGDFSKHPRMLWGIFVVAAIALLTLNVFLFSMPDSLSSGRPGIQGMATATGSIGVCVNSPPVIDLSSCQSAAFTNTLYNCTLAVSDQQQSTFSYAVTRTAGNTSLDSLLVMSGGSLAFTANHTHIGNYTLLFTVNDLSGCGGAASTAYFNLSVNFSSDAPYLVSPVPDKTWNANTVLIAFNLNDYFADPNNDVLAYAAFNNTNVRIDINAAGEVVLTPALNWCGTETVYFRASDPDGNTADSNVVTLTVNCVSSTPPASSSGASGGGGGGGASALRNSCRPSYACLEWSSCQLTRVVSPVTGNSSLIEITGVVGNRVYRIPTEYSTDPSAYYSGFEYQECFDSLQCTDDLDVRVRPCSYKPSCSDNLQNQDETAIDCGGTICKPCGTCVDGIQNGFETGLDCGGSVCPACNSCTNGKIDGKELGIDCGGPDCPTCASCFDGVQNQDETGVDCGGKYCSSCSEKQYPISAGLPWLTGILLLLVGLVFAFLFATALKRTFATLFMRYQLKHKRKNRVILISSNLKDDIIRRLAELEKNVDKDPILKSQEELARIIRDYFKEALKLDFEFTYEELVQTLNENRLNPLLSQILQRYFIRISELEFSGVVVTPLMLKTLIQEMRELVYQTAVLTIDDLKEREKDLELRDIPRDAPSVDRAYLLLSQVHLCLQFHKLEIGAAVYTVLREWYLKAPQQEQQLIYNDMARVHDEYALALSRT